MLGLSCDLHPQRREASEDLLSERLMREGGLHAAVLEYAKNEVRRERFNWSMAWRLRTVQFEWRQP